MFTLFKSVNSMAISLGLIEGCRANYNICKDSNTLSYDNDSLYVVTVFWGKGKKQQLPCSTQICLPTAEQ